MIEQFFSRQFLHFLVAGGTAALVNWLSRIMLNKWFSFSEAVFWAYIFGMLVAFIINTYFVFPKTSKPQLIQARDFFLTNICFIPVVWIIAITLNNLLNTMHINHSEEIAHGISIAIPMFATFLIYKFFVFKRR
jgi:putative flippase GtrA